jgi:hypothetical protein
MSSARAQASVGDEAQSLQEDGNSKLDVLPELLACVGYLELGGST